MDETEAIYPNGKGGQQSPHGSQSAKKDRNEGAPSSGDKKPRGRGKFFLYGFITGVVVLAVALGVAFALGAFTMLHSYLNPPNEEPRITDAFISGKLENASEVTSAKYIFSGIKDYEEGFIPVINHSKFSMYYTATVRAGIENTADILKEITDKEVIITLPAAQILDVHIHPSSLRYFDKEDPLFHPNDREQVAKLLDIAEADAKTADMSELLDLADEQLEKIMTEIFEDAIGDYKLVIKHGERTVATAEDAVVDSEGDNQ